MRQIMTVTLEETKAEMTDLLDRGYPEIRVVSTPTGWIIEALGDENED